MQEIEAGPVLYASFAMYDEWCLLYLYSVGLRADRTKA